MSDCQCPATPKFSAIVTVKTTTVSESWSDSQDTMVGGLSLRLLWPCFTLIVGLDAVSLSGNPFYKSFARYKAKYNTSSIDYASCSSIFHNSYTVEYAEYDEICHLSQLSPDTDIMDKYGFEACCLPNGVLETERCQGTNKDGEKTTFQNVNFCLDHDKNETLEIIPATLDACPLGCELLSEKLIETEYDNTTKKYKNEYNALCVGSMCDDDGQYQLEIMACGKCGGEASQELNAESLTSPCAVGTEGCSTE